MFCIHCGAKLPEQAKFCAQCGKKIELPETVQPPEAETDNSETIWETCEIVYVLCQEKVGLFPKEKGRFAAVVVREDGPVTMAQSSLFNMGALNLYGPDKKNKQHTDTLEALQAVLESAGWQRETDRGQFWYSTKFRRKIL